MSKIKSIPGLQGSRWGFHPKAATNSRDAQTHENNQDDEEDETSSMLQNKDQSEENTQSHNEHPETLSDTEDNSDLPTQVSEHLISQALSDAVDTVEPLLDQDSTSDEHLSLVTESHIDDEHTSENNAPSPDTITEQEWSVIEQASAALQHSQDDEGSEDENLEHGIGEHDNHQINSLEKTFAKDAPDSQSDNSGKQVNSGGGDQIGVEALLDLGKQNNHHDDDIQEITSQEKLNNTQAHHSLSLDADHSDSSQTLPTVADNNNNNSNNDNSVTVSNETPSYSQSRPLESSYETSYQEKADTEESPSASRPTTSHSVTSQEEAPSKKRKRSNSSYSSTSALIAAAAAAISSTTVPPQPALSSSASSSSSHNSAASGSTLDPDIQEFLDNPEHPNWQRFYAESIESNEDSPQVDLSILINETSNASTSAPAAPLPATVTTANTATTHHSTSTTKPPAKRGRKRKVVASRTSIAEQDVGNATAPIVNSNVDPALEQLDMSAAAAAAVQLSKEQSQLKDAMMHASAIVRILQSQSGGQSEYDDNILPEVEKTSKRSPRSSSSLTQLSSASSSTPPRASSHSTTTILSESDGSNGDVIQHDSGEATYKDLNLDDAIEMVDIKYQGPTLETRNDETVSEESSAAALASLAENNADTQNRTSDSSVYWNQQHPNPADSDVSIENSQVSINSQLEQQQQQLQSTSSTTRTRKKRGSNSSSASTSTQAQDKTKPASSKKTQPRPRAKRTNNLHETASSSGITKVLQKSKPPQHITFVNPILEINGTPSQNWQPTQTTTPERGGSFTLAEMALLDNFMSRYCIMNHLTRELLCQRVWSNERRKDHFWDDVAEVLPHRTRASIYKHIRRAYHVFQSRGKWTPEEDERLGAMYEAKGPQWKLIGAEMGRMPEDCRDRWRNYVKCGNNRVQNKWNVVEENRLREVVTQIMSENPEAEVNWTTVSEHMGGTRSRIQCRYKWNKMMKRATVAKIEAMMTDDKLALVKYLLENGYEDESQVDWDGFAAMDSRGFWSGKELQMAFERLKPKGSSIPEDLSFRRKVQEMYDGLSAHSDRLKLENLNHSSSSSVTNVPASLSAIPEPNIPSAAPGIDIASGQPIHIATSLNAVVTAPATLYAHTPPVPLMNSTSSIDKLSEHSSSQNAKYENQKLGEQEVLGESKLVSNGEPSTNKESENDTESLSKSEKEIVAPSINSHHQKRDSENSGQEEESRQQSHEIDNDNNEDYDIKHSKILASEKKSINSNNNSTEDNETGNDDNNEEDTTIDENTTDNDNSNQENESNKQALKSNLNVIIDNATTPITTPTTSTSNTTTARTVRTATTVETEEELMAVAVAAMQQTASSSVNE